MKRVKVNLNGKPRHAAAVESEVFRDLFPLVEALASLSYDDGSPRRPGYLGIWVSGAAWVARITDKDADASLTCEGRSLDEALGLLSLLLGAEDAPWEPAGKRRRK